MCCNDSRGKTVGELINQSRRAPNDQRILFIAVGQQMKRLPIPPGVSRMHQFTADDMQSQSRMISTPTECAELREHLQGSIAQSFSDRAPLGAPTPVASALDCR